MTIDELNDRSKELEARKLTLRLASRDGRATEEMKLELVCVDAALEKVHDAQAKIARQSLVARVEEFRADHPRRQEWCDEWRERLRK